MVGVGCVIRFCDNVCMHVVLCKPSHSGSCTNEECLRQQMEAII